MTDNKQGSSKQSSSAVPEVTKQSSKNSKPETSPKNPRMWILWLVISLVLLLVGLGITGAVVAKQLALRADGPRAGLERLEGRGMGMDQGFRGGGYGSQELKESETQSDGLNSTTTTTTYVVTRGVVTAVSDSSITVAGYGESQKIALNSDTDYTSDEKPAVNDTVIVKSTKADDGTLTASVVRIFN